jgi:CHASE2 domain-containing sensor protein
MMKKNLKLVSFWMLGAICMLLGSMIAGNVERTTGVNETGFSTALVISFVLFLLGGILWISVATATRVSEE